MSVSQYYSRELEIYVRKVVQIIPKMMFEKMARIIEIQTSVLKELPTRLEKDRLKEFAQLDERFEFAELTHSISVFSEGEFVFLYNIFGFNNVYVYFMFIFVNHVLYKRYHFISLFSVSFTKLKITFLIDYYAIVFFVSLIGNKKCASFKAVFYKDLKNSFFQVCV